MLPISIEDSSGHVANVTAAGQLEVSVTGVNFPDATLSIPGYATEVTLSAVDVGIDAVNAALALVGSEVTSAAILAKIPSGGATAANQSTANGYLTSIVANSGTSDATLTSILAKQPSDPATKASVDAVTAKINGAATTIGQYNIPMAVVDTEYTQALPSNCKEIEFWSRSGEEIRFAFTTGKVAGLTSPYFTLRRGATYQSYGSLNLSGVVLYVATDTAGDVVEMMTWS